jgi:hypothetical protein
LKSVNNIIPLAVDDNLSVTASYDTEASGSVGTYFEAFDFTVTIKTEYLKTTKYNDTYLTNFEPGYGIDSINVVGELGYASFIPVTTPLIMFSFSLSDSDGKLLQNTNLPMGIDFSLVDNANFNVNFDYTEANDQFQFGSFTSELTNGFLVSVIPIPLSLWLFVSGLISLRLVVKKDLGGRSRIESS